MSTLEETIEQVRKRNFSMDMAVYRFMGQCEAILDHPPCAVITDEYRINQLRACLRETREKLAELRREDLASRNGFDQSKGREGG